MHGEHENRVSARRWRRRRRRVLSKVAGEKARQRRKRVKGQDRIDVPGRNGIASAMSGTIFRAIPPRDSHSLVPSRNPFSRNIWYVRTHIYTHIHSARASDIFVIGYYSRLKIRNIKSDNTHGFLFRRYSTRKFNSIDGKTRGARIKIHEALPTSDFRFS